MKNKDRKWMCKIIFIYCWQIWKNRNRMIFKGKQLNIDLILSIACKLVKDLETMNRDREKEKAEKSSQTPPRQDFVKMNFNGDLSMNKQTTRMGVVIRDARGKALFMRVKK